MNQWIIWSINRKTRNSVRSLWWYKYEQLVFFLSFAIRLISHYWNCPNHHSKKETSSHLLSRSHMHNASHYMESHYMESHYMQWIKRTISGKVMSNIWHIPAQNAYCKVLTVWCSDWLYWISHKTLFLPSHPSIHLSFTRLLHCPFRQWETRHSKCGD